jgi:FkbM family methyltransferase
MKRYLRWAVVRAPGVERLRRDLQHTWQRMMRLPFDPDFAALRMMAPRADELLLDVGSNQGLAIGAMRLFRPGSRIVAFEPNRRLAENLRRRFAGDRSIAVHDVGLDEAASNRTLYLPRYRGYPFFGLASMIREEAEGWLSEATMAGFDGRDLEVEALPCAVKPLDAFELRPTFIKLDVQGVEDRVIRGGMRTIEASRPVLMIESGASIARCEALLQPLGYRTVACDGRGWTDDVRGRMNVFMLSGESNSGRRSTS